jgi:hypothetical protein
MLMESFAPVPGLKVVSRDPGGWITENSTGISCGVLEAPVAVMVIVALYVPAFSPEILAETLTVLVLLTPVDEPDVGDNVSQLASSLTPQFRVPPPEFQMLSVLFDGLVPPTVPLKVKLLGEKLIVGDAGDRFRVTGTVRGVLEAPVAVIVIVAL